MKVDPAALETFVRRLNELWIASGRPSMRFMARESEHVVADHRDEHPGMYPLTAATLSRLLGGQRVTAPKWTLVACFVLTCRRCAAATPGLPEGHADVDLPTWHRWLEEVYRPETADDASGGSGGSGGAGNSEQAEGSDGSAATAYRGRHRRTAADPPHGERTPRSGEHSMAQERFFRAFAEHGVALLEASDRGDPDASYRIAILLLLDGCPSEARAFLEKVEKGGGHTMAIELNAADEPIEVAAEHAYWFGAFAFAGDDYQTASVYYRYAAGQGHADAAFGQGVLRLRSGSPEEAAYWFHRAAAAGHEYSLRRLDGIYRTLLGRDLDAPLTADEELLADLDAPDSTPPCGLSTAE